MAVAVHRARHGLICHEERDDTIGASLSRYGEWAEEEIYLLSGFVERESVVLDLGANVGTHTLAFSRMAARGLVVAVEAQVRMHELLALNLVLNEAGNVKSIRALAKEKSGLRFVPPEDHEARTNFGAVSFVDAPRTEADNLSLDLLPVLAVDDLALARCDLMKIDVEGMELDVLRGATKTVARHRPAIYFEQTGAARFLETFDFFKQVDYDLFWHAADPFNRNNFRGHSENIFGGTREINILALPRKKMEKFRAQISLLIPIHQASYHPPPRQGPVTGWHLPENAYGHLAPVAGGNLSQRIVAALGT